MDNYEKLQQILHTNPAGAPESESFDEILRILFTPEEVKIAIVMSFALKSIHKIAKEAGSSIEHATELCESMANKGIIFSREKKGETGYALLPTLPGLFEFPFMAGGGTPIHERLGKLWERYHLESQGKEFGSSPTPLARVIPVEKSITTHNEVLPYEVISRMMEKSKTFAMAHCACRVAAGEKACDKPKEVCLFFDSTAIFLTERKLAMKITREEAEVALRKSEEAGLVHTCNNSQDRLSFICNCCPCCCLILTGLTKISSPYPFARGRWFARVDDGLCIGCGLCREERCVLEAITLDSDTAEVDHNRCIGCGLCASTCPESAISMELREDHTVPPNTISELGAQILLEKGRLQDYSELNKP
jgi:ferredoxin